MKFEKPHGTYNPNGNVIVCAEVTTVNVQMYDKPYIYWILRKTGCEMFLFDSTVENPVRLSMSSGEIYDF